MPEAGYKRNMNQNYLILSGSELDEIQFEMVQNNEIAGLLKVHGQWMNGKRNLYYDISSKQPISRIYAKKEFCFNEIKNLFYALGDIYDRISKYTLDEGAILLYPDFCYQDLETQKIEWVLYPSLEEDTGIEALAEFLIERVDHKDVCAVELVYSFFKKIREDNFSLCDMIRIMEEEQGEKCIEGNVYDENLSQIETVSKREEISIDCTAFCDETQTEETYQEGKRGQNRTILLILIGVMVLGAILCLKEGYAMVPLILILIAVGLGLFGWMQKRKLQRNDSIKEITKDKLLQFESTFSPQFVTSKEESDYTCGETTVIGSAMQKSQRILKGFERGREVEYSLEKLPLVFGKMKECVDIVVDVSSVSRMHARIFEENEELYLEDLNSKNGTYKNGLQLDANEIVEILPGDEIRMADVTFTYQ